MEIGLNEIFKMFGERQSESKDGRKADFLYVCERRENRQKKQKKVERREKERERGRTLPYVGTRE